jgi:hypothetical protein
MFMAKSLSERESVRVPSGVRTRHSSNTRACADCWHGVLTGAKAAETSRCAPADPARDPGLSRGRPPSARPRRMPGGAASAARTGALGVGVEGVRLREASQQGPGGDHCELQAPELVHRHVHHSSHAATARGPVQQTLLVALRGAPPSRTRRPVEVGTSRSHARAQSQFTHPR